MRDGPGRGPGAGWGCGGGLDLGQGGGVAGAQTWAGAGMLLGCRPGPGWGYGGGVDLGRDGGAAGARDGSVAGAQTWAGAGVRLGRGPGAWMRGGMGAWIWGGAQGLGPGAGWRHGPGAERRAQGRRGVGLTQTVHPQVVPRQPDQSAGRAHADACAPGRGLPGAETERAQLLRHLLPVRGLPWGTGGAAGHPWCRPTDPVWLLCPCQGLRARSSTAASSRRARP